MELSGCCFTANVTAWLTVYDASNVNLSCNLGLPVKRYLNFMVLVGGGR